MITKQQAIDIGVEAYVYLYPLITMEVTRQVMTNVPPGQVPGMGPAGAFQHLRAYPDASFKAVVRPNFDTLYSSAWVDVEREPVILSVPETDGRYYLLPMLDMWTDVFAVPGTRTTGAAAGNFAIVREGWQGTLPPGVQRIEAPTPTVWIIGRTQTNGPADYAAVHTVQDAYHLTPLSQWPHAPEPPAFVFDPSVDMKTPPLVQVDKMPAEDFFCLGAELVQRHRPHKSDWSQVARRRLFGLGIDDRFDWNRLAPVLQEGLQAAPAIALEQMRARSNTMARTLDGWQMNTDTMGVYGDHYLKRAIVAMIGLGANQAVDAIYPISYADADGNPYDGDGAYVQHFDKEQIPPVDAFWSITMYDAQGFQCANELDRFAIGDRDALAQNADGSLDIWYQHENPGPDKVSNWLPAPAGPWTICMRLYAPRPQALDGRWNPPPVKRIA
jgi:hypothetical protein